MVESLDRASQQLSAALDNYLSVCNFIRNSHTEGGSINNTEKFYNRLESEWNQSSAYKTKLAEAQTAINATRNARPTTINSLPPEILVQIFSLLFNGQPCIFARRYPTSSFIEVTRNRVIYPDCLSHVCSSWRRLITSLPRFWSHIDLVLNHPSNPRLFSRAKTFATRVGKIPLHIHIRDSGYALEWQSDWYEVARGGKKPSKRFASGPDPSTLFDFEFLSSLPADIGSLDIQYAPQKERPECHIAAIEYFLRNCKPGVFTHYSITNRDAGVNQDRPFLEPADRPSAPATRIIAILHRQFEHLWLGTSSLRINGTSPPWNSQAYHGLTELRLDEEAPPIRESQLVNVLKSSPKLRVFHLRTNLERMSPLSRSVEPVRLEDLEELDMKEFSESDITHGAFLRWIAPGPKPLKLSFNGWSDEAGTALFATRSNITHLYLEGSEEDGAFDNVILHHLSRLELLSLNAHGIEEVGLDSILPRLDWSGKKTSATCINTLYLLNFNRVSLRAIQDTIKRHSVKRLVVRKTTLTYATERGDAVASNSQEVKALLSTLHPLPVIQYLTNRSSLDPESWQEW